MPTRRDYSGYLYILPAVLVLSIFIVYPALWTIRLSFYAGRGFNFDRFVGLANYTRLLTSDRLFLDLSEFPPQGALINNLYWIILFVPLTILLGLFIAILADKVRYEATVKAIIFLPMAIAATAVAIIWLFVYSPDPNIGVLNAMIDAVGGTPVSWLGRTDTVNFAVIIAQVWASTGFAMVVLSAALKSIPNDIIEAARTDGANEWQIFRGITLPMLSLPISVVAVTLTINVLKVFDIIYIMTAGGPRGASRVIAFTMYAETFQAGRGGYGAAVAVIMLLLIIPIMLFNIRRFQSERVVR